MTGAFGVPLSQLLRLVECEVEEFAYNAQLKVGSVVVNSRIFFDPQLHPSGKGAVAFFELVDPDVRQVRLWIREARKTYYAALLFKSPKGWIPVRASAESAAEALYQLLCA